MLLSTLLNGSPEVSIGGEITSDGAVIFPQMLDQALGWNPDGTLNYVQVVVPPMAETSYMGGTYRQTFTYAAGAVSAISRWVKQ